MIFAILEILIPLAVLYLVFWYGVLCGETGALRVSWPPRFANRAPKWPDWRSPSPPDVVERLVRTAKAWQEMRANPFNYSPRDRTVTEHWFYCLAWVVGCPRRGGESLDQWIARAACGRIR